MLLIEALIQTRIQSDLAEAYAEAWERGPAWKEAMARGMSYMPRRDAELLKAGLAEGLAELGLDPTEFGLETMDKPSP